MNTPKETPTRIQQLRPRLWACAPLGVIIMALSMSHSVQMHLPGWQWIVFALSLPVVIWGAWPFHVAAFRAARHGASTMDTLVSLGIIASTLWSTWALLFGGAGRLGLVMPMHLLPTWGSDGPPAVYFEGAAMITVFLLAGRYFEARARRRSGDALCELLNLGAKTATLLTGDLGSDGIPLTETTIPASQLQVGDLFRVRPGEKIATDAVVVNGHSAVDESMLTGESVPVEVGAGARLSGGTLNTSGTLVARVTAVGKDTALAHITKLVEDAQAAKAPIARLADRISAVFVPTILALSLLTFAGWMLGTSLLSAGPDWRRALTAAVSVLVIACPCALGLATPVALLVGSTRASRLGILLRGPEVLETTRALDVIAFDKTGTLTQGQLQVQRVVVPGEFQGSGGAVSTAEGGASQVQILRSQSGALALVGALENPSEHPIAKALTQTALTQTALTQTALEHQTELNGESVAGGETVPDVSPAGQGSQTTDGLERDAKTDSLEDIQLPPISGFHAFAGAGAGGIIDLSDLRKTPMSAFAVIDLLDHLGVKDEWLAGHAGVQLPERIALAAGRLDWLTQVINGPAASQALPTGLRGQIDDWEKAGYTVIGLAVGRDWSDRQGAGEGLNSIAGGEGEARGGQQASAKENTAATATQEVQLAITGMTCAACVARVEKKLGKLPGVHASVNLATEKALVSAPAGMDAGQLVATVEKAGYGASVLQINQPSAAPVPGTVETAEGSLDSMTGVIGQTGHAVLTEAGQTGHAVLTEVGLTEAGQTPTGQSPSGENAVDGHLIDGTLAALFLLTDPLKDGAAQVVGELRAQGLQPALISGDSEGAALKVASEIGIDLVYGRVTPQVKAQVIAQLQHEGQLVAMVGDGINDAPALAQAAVAGVGIAMGSGTDAAKAAADITLVTSQLEAVPAAIRICRATLRVIKENLFWAFAYNVAALPLAMAGLLNPMIAGAAMACSSLIVVGNSLRLARIK